MFDAKKTEQSVPHEVILVLQSLLGEKYTTAHYKKFLQDQKETFFRKTEVPHREAVTNHIAEETRSGEEYSKLVSTFNRLNDEYLEYRKNTEFPYFPKFTLQNAYKALVMVDHDRVMPRGHLIVKMGGKYISGKCCLFRTPCNLPNDIQTFTAMTEGQIQQWWQKQGQSAPSYLLENVIIVSGRTGDGGRAQKPVMDLLSGGDFDGDTCYVVFQKDLTDILINSDRKESTEVRRCDEIIKKFERTDSRKDSSIGSYRGSGRFSDSWLDKMIVAEGRSMIKGADMIGAMSKAWYSLADKFGAGTMSAICVGLGYQRALDGMLTDGVMNSILQICQEIGSQVHYPDLKHTAQWRLCKYKGYYNYPVEAGSKKSQFMQGICDETQQMCKPMLLNPSLCNGIEKLFRACQNVKSFQLKSNVRDAERLWDLIQTKDECEEEKKKKLYIIVSKFLVADGTSSGGNGGGGSGNVGGGGRNGGNSYSGNSRNLNGSSRNINYESHSIRGQQSFSSQEKDVHHYYHFNGNHDVVNTRYNYRSRTYYGS